MKKKLSRATIYRTRRVGVFNNIKNILNLYKNIKCVLFNNPLYSLFVLSLFMFVFYATGNSDVNLVLNDNAENIRNAVSYTGNLSISLYLVPVAYMGLFYLFFSYPYFKEKNSYKKGLLIVFNPKFYFIILMFFSMFFLIFWFLLSFFYNFVEFELPIDYSFIVNWFKEIGFWGRSMVIFYASVSLIIMYICSLTFYLMFFYTNVKKIKITMAIYFSYSYVIKNILIMVFNTLFLVLLMVGIFFLKDFLDFRFLQYLVSFLLFVYSIGWINSQAEKSLSKEIK
tara:strand:+ start:772 stop:1620 length:849 start_codon:yes stop_codon:yes gene_type:complete